MKKVLVIFLFFILLIPNAKAEIKLELNDPVIRFEKEGSYVLQGFTTVKDKLFTVFINDDESKSLVKIFDLKTNQVVKEFENTSLGHANDVTYNDKEDRIYVVHGGGTKLLHVFDGTSFEYLGEKIVQMPLRSLAYLSEQNLYAGRTVSVGFYFDGNLELVNGMPFIIGMNMSSDVARQGWTYYNGFLYYSTWSWIRMGGDGTNTIIVYSLNGYDSERLVTKGNIGELEDVSFYNNKMILGINTYDDFIEFYSIDNPKIEKVIKEEKVIEEKEEEKKDTKPIIILVVSLLVITILFIIRARKKM